MAVHDYVARHGKGSASRETLYTAAELYPGRRSHQATSQKGTCPLIAGNFAYHDCISQRWRPPVGPRLPLWCTSS
jgi:hypothetical protein